MSSERRSEMNRRKNVAQRRTTNGRACVHCHYRKVRCDVVDKGSPCSNCRVHGQPNCQVYQRSKTRSARARGAHVVAIAPKDPEAEAAAAAACTSAQDEEHEPGNLADLVYRQDLRDAELGQLGRMCFIGSDVSNFGYLVRQVAQPQRRDAFHFGSRQFARRHTAHELQRVPPEALTRCAAPLERRLLRAYFDRVNPGWPIVDEEHFMAQYRGGDARNPLMLPLLNAMLLVGVHVLRARGEEEGGGGGGGELAQLQKTFFRRAKTLIDCRFEQDRTMYVQVALLMTWYSDGHEEIVANAWHWIGFAIRIAIGHGMHRDVTHSKMLPVHRRLWTRLWWILFQFDTAVSAAYGRPQILNLDESDVPELEPAHFQGVPNAQVDFAMQHAKLCAIFASAMRSRWALRSSTHDRVAASRRADDALAAFLLQLPPALKPSAAAAAAAARPSWTATLHLTYNNFVLLLHRPPPVAGTDAVSAACADPALCAGATASMAAILEALCCDDGGAGGDDALWLYGVHAAFTALIYVSNELAAPSPMVAARARSLFDTLMDALRRLARYWQFAESLLRLFRQKEASLLLKDGVAAAATTAAGEPRLSAAERFSLRPAPLAPVPWEDATGGCGHAAPQRLEDDYLASRSAGEATQQQQHDGELHVDELMVEGYPDSFALELFLAGMDGSTQDCV
ncbi:hypothetical protein G3M48_003953 [Beauveria asiatica]|uniref:Zn(2)-C6 fungal-type domain-containing protein n=1 Tax=Beauveria asiatica TaxID=1069075 RepID=A0AAW0RUY0_9HYPO